MLWDTLLGTYNSGSLNEWLSNFIWGLLCVNVILVILLAL